MGESGSQGKAVLAVSSFRGFSSQPDSCRQIMVLLATSETVWCEL